MRYWLRRLRDDGTGQTGNSCHWIQVECSDTAESRRFHVKQTQFWSTSVGRSLRYALVSTPPFFKTS